MKVILLQDVAKIGRRYEVASVPDGHAMNMLIPRGMAEPATAENMKKIKARQAKKDSDAAASDADFGTAKEKIAEMKSITVSVEATEKGGLFKGLKAEDVAAHLAENGVIVDASDVVLDVPIKETGEHEVLLQRGDQKVSCMYNVTAA